MGAGNLATSLGVALVKAGVNPVAVWSRTKESAQMLAERLSSPFFTEIKEMPDADIVIISVADSALEAVAREVVAKFPSAIIAHTAGSVPMQLLGEAGAVNYGVFYPMQTFSKQREVDFSAVTIFVEGCCGGVEAHLERLARCVTDKVVHATSEQRKCLHVAAVFACNFANATYCMAASLLEEKGLSFDAMLPLVDETAMKVHSLHPRVAQTGPARRGDKAVMEAHLAMLDGELKDIYAIMSNYITADARKK